MNNHQPNNSKNVLPASLDQQLNRFRRRLRLLKLIEISFAAAICFLLAYVILFVVERFVAMPSLVRLLLLIVSTAGLTVGFPLTLRNWFWRTRRLDQVARLLSRTFPVLGDEILSVIEMADDRADQGSSPQLVEAATQQTGARVAKRDLFTAIKWDTANHRGLSLLCIAALVLLGMIFVPAAANNTWLRLLNPWTDVKRYTFAQLGAFPDEMVVPYGESFQVDVPILGESQWKPTSGLTSIGSSKITTTRQGDTYPFSLPAQTADTKATVSIGDQNKTIEIKPMTRPELIGITSVTRLPDYLQYPDPITEKSSSGRFGVLRDSEIKFNLETNRELESATLDNQPLPIHGQAISISAKKVKQSSAHTINWRDRSQLQPRRPLKLEINSIDDKPPSIVFEQLKDSVLLQDKSLRFDFSARDDYGIMNLGIEWVSAETALDGSGAIRGEKLLFAGTPQQRDVNQQGIFTPKLENVTPQVLILRLFVEDYKPGRERIYSRPQTVHLMSHNEHVAWINENMQRWKSGADAIYEREVAIAEENKALLNQDPIEQTKPESIRRLENQIAAERDNAQRLEKTVDEGSKLIREALMNKNMSAEQVAKWAESLRQLRGIARDDMPQLAQQLNAVRDNLQNQRNAVRGDPASKKNQQNELSHSSQRQKKQEKKDGQQSPQLAIGENHLKSLNKLGDSDGNEMNQRKNGQHGLEEDAQTAKPKIRDSESSMFGAAQREEAQAEGKGKGKEKSSKGFTIPETKLLALKQPSTQQSPTEGAKEGNGGAPQTSENEPSMDGVVEDQAKFLEEFKKARDAMDELMGDFENSTFVRRFKSASREQLAIAKEINRLIPKSFGLGKIQRPETNSHFRNLVESQANIYETLRELQIDLKAYQARDPNAENDRVLSDMDSSNMLVKLGEIPKRMEKNRLGDSIHRTEFWADTFDRWGEELVPPSAPKDPNQPDDKNGQAANLPPAIALEIMRQIDDEMTLRDETRNYHQTRKVMPADEQQERNDGLTIYQMAIQERSLDTIEDINDIPEGSQNFGEELGKVQKAVEAMEESSGMLFDGTSGEPTLAAESAAIESLLASQRTPPLPPEQEQQDPSDGTDGSESLESEKLNLANLLPDLFRNPRVNARDVGAANSSSVDQVPERFREGIDRFTNKLGRLRSRRSKSN